MQGRSGVTVICATGHSRAYLGRVWGAEPMTLRDLYDWETSTALLARQAPFWKPGRTSGYHGMNHGHLVREVVRRVTGKTLGTFLTEDVAGPLGVGEDYHIGTPAGYEHRVSLLIQGAPHDYGNGNWLHDISLHNPHQTPQDTWSLDWRRAEMGAMNGHGNARAIATLQSVLACGRANGVKLISDAGRERVMEQQSDGVDQVMGVACRRGMGHSLETSIFPVYRQTRVWPGGAAAADRCRSSTSTRAWPSGSRRTVGSAGRTSKPAAAISSRRRTRAWSGERALRMDARQALSRWAPRA
jgi:CubicO group peptidase (beta-lactamase class C family)